MKRILIFSSILFLLSFTSKDVHAQRQFFTASYNIGFPSGEFRNFISENSFRGFAFTYKRILDPGISIGIESGWNNFFEKIPRQTFDFNGGAINTAQWRYTHFIPVLITADYHFLKSGTPLRPFAGFGIGAYIMEQELLVGVISIFDRYARFGMAPELGVTFDIPNTSLGFLFSSKYNFIANANSFQDGSLGYWSLNMGVGFFLD